MPTEETLRFLARSRAEVVAGSRGERCFAAIAGRWGVVEGYGWTSAEALVDAVSRLLRRLR